MGLEESEYNDAKQISHCMKVRLLPTAVEQDALHTALYAFVLVLLVNISFISAFIYIQANYFVTVVHGGHVIKVVCACC